MKLRNLLMTVIAGAAMLVGCNKEADLGPAKLSVNPDSVSFTAEEGAQDISILATRDWIVSGIPEEGWLTIDESGLASETERTLQLSVLENTGNNRTATLVFTIGFARVTLTVTQAGPEGEVDLGDGSKDNPYTVAGVIAYLETLGKDVNSPNKVFVKGKVSDITGEKMEQFSTEYGNGTFKISDDGTQTGAQFMAFRVLYLGNQRFTANDTAVKEGDDVIIYGNVVNYKGNTPETVQNSAFLYSLNGVDKGGAEDTPTPGEGEAKGDGTLENPYNPTAITAIAAELADNAVSEQSYYIKGKISKIATSKGVEQYFANSGDYGNASFYITDAEDGTGEFYIYQTYYLGNRKWVTGDTDVAVGDEVIIYGPVTKYVSSYGTTLETAGKGASYIYSLNGQTEGGTEPGPVDDIQSISISDFIAAADENTYYRLTGTVSNFKINSQENKYMQFNVSDQAGATVLAYGFKNGQFDEWSTKIQDGGTVTLTGTYKYYANTQAHEVMNTTIESFTAAGEEPGPQPGDADGLSPETAFTAEQAYDWVVANLEAGADTGEQKYYVKGKVTKFYQRNGADQNFANNSYHQASFYMNDVEGKDFEAYQINYLGGATWAEGDTDVAVGDDVVIYGPLKHYVASSGAVIAETTAQGTAYLYSLNGKTAGGDTPEPVEPGDVDFDKATTIKLDATQTWAAATDNTYGAGFGATDASGIQVAIGKYESSNALVQPDQYGTKVYKKAVITLTAPTGRKIIGVRFKASDYSNGQYCKPLTVLEPAGGGTLAADATTFMIGDWTGEATKVAFQALEAQARLLEAYVVLDGEGGGDQPGPGPEPGTGNDGLTPETAFTVAEAIAKAQEAGIVGSDKEYYVRGFVYRSVDFTHDATFEMMGSSIQELFTIYRTKSFGGADWTGQEPLGWGDDVIVKGKLATMYGSTPVLNNGTLVSWNGETSFGQGGEEPAEIQDKTIAEFKRLADTQNAYRLTATIESLGSYQDAAGVTVTTFDIKDATGTITVRSLAEGEAFKWANSILQGASIVLVGTYDEITIPGNTNMTPVVVNATIESCEGGGEEPQPSVATTLLGIIDQISADSINANTASEYTAELTGAVVTYVNGGNVYLEDESAGLLLYLRDSGLAAGDKISGKVSGKGYYYNGLPEITAIGTEYAKTSGNDIPLTELSIRDLIGSNASSYYSRRVIVKGVTVTTGVNSSNRNGTISQDNSEMVLRSGASSVTLEAGSEGDIIGFPTVYNGTYQLTYWEGFTASSVEPEPQPTEATTIAGIIDQISADAINANTASEYTAELTGAVVSYVNGGNVYLEDETAGLLLYLRDSGLQAGDKISGKVSGKGYYYNGLPEITAIGTEYTKGTGTIPETEVSISDLIGNNAASYYSRRVIVKGVSVTTGVNANNRNGAIAQGQVNMVLRSGASSVTLEAGLEGDIIGFPTVYNGTYQLTYWEGFTAAESPVEEIQNATIAEFIRLADAQNAYRLSGTASNVLSYIGQQMEQVLQFTLTDNSGSIDVVSLAAGEADKWYEKVKEGSSVVLTGTYSFVADATQLAAPTVVNATIESCEGGNTPGDVTSGDITFDFSTMGFANGTQQTSISDSSNKVTVTFGAGSNDGKYYDTGEAIRVYGNGWCQVASNSTITKIVYTFDTAQTNANNGAMGYPNDAFPFEVDGGSFEMDASGAPVGTWTGSATSVKATRASGSGHWRIKKIVVTVE